MEEPKAKRSKPYRERVEAELRAVRGAMKTMDADDPAQVASLHLQVATTLALLDLAEAIRDGRGL